MGVWITSWVTTGEGDGVGAAVVVITVGMGVTAVVIAGVTLAVPGVVPNEFEKITMPPMTTKITIASAAIGKSFVFMGGSAGSATGVGGGDVEGVASTGTGSIVVDCEGGSASGTTMGGSTSGTTTGGSTNGATTGGSTTWVSTMGGGAG